MYLVKRSNLIYYVEFLNPATNKMTGNAELRKVITGDNSESIKSKYVKDKGKENIVCPVSTGSTKNPTASRYRSIDLSNSPPAANLRPDTYRLKH